MGRRPPTRMGSGRSALTAHLDRCWSQAPIPRSISVLGTSTATIYFFGDGGLLGWGLSPHPQAPVRERARIHQFHFKIRVELGGKVWTDRSFAVGKV